MNRFSIDRTFETLARGVVRFRWLVVGFWLVVAIVVSGAFPSLGSEVNNDNSAFLRASAPSTKAANLAAPLLGGGAGKTSQIIVVASRDGKLTPADLSAIQREAAAVRKVNGVLGIQGLEVSSDGQGVQLRVRVNAARNDIGSDMYHDLGLPLAIGMAIMLSLGLTLLPALLAIFGRAVFWPSRIKPGPQRDGLWARIAARLVRRPALTLGVGAVLFLALAAVALGYSSSGFGGATSAPSGSDAAAGNTALAAHFPQTSSNPANLVFEYPDSVAGDPSALVAAQGSLRSSGQFAAISGPLNPNGTTLTPARYAQLHAELGPPGRLPVREPASLNVPRSDYNAYRASSQFISADGKVVQYEASLTAGSQQSTQAMSATPTIRDVVTQAANRSGAVQSGVAGEAAASYDISTTANHDLRLIVPIAIVAIGLLLALVLRSLVAPLYLIVSVLLSYLAALGVATLVFIDIGGDSGVSFFLPFLMFVFLFALGEDYNILVMTRIREEARRLPLREAVVRAVGRTGSTVTSAGLILGGTFIVLTVASSGAEASQIRAIGLGLAAGILIDTFLARTLLVPATVILLGRRNWWPSRMGREVAPHRADAHPRGAADPSEVTP